MKQNIILFPGPFVSNIFIDHEKIIKLKVLYSIGISE